VAANTQNILQNFAGTCCFHLQIQTSESSKNAVFLILTLCILDEAQRRFRGTCYLHHVYTLVMEASSCCEMSVSDLQSNRVESLKSRRTVKLCAKAQRLLTYLLTYVFHPLLPSGVEGIPESLPLLSILYCPFHLFPCYSFLSCHLL
jgi:hypothetical protein